MRTAESFMYYGAEVCANALRFEKKPIAAELRRGALCIVLVIAGVIPIDQALYPTKIATTQCIADSRCSALSRKTRIINGSLEFLKCAF